MATINNAALLSGAFDRVANMNAAQYAAAQKLPGAIAGTADTIKQQYTAGQVAKALGEGGDQYGAASVRAMELGDQDLAVKYAELRDKDLARQQDVAFQNARLGLEREKLAAAQKGQQEDPAVAARTQQTLNDSLDDLQQLADSGDLTTWGYRRAAAGFGSESHRNATGKMKAAIAGIAPVAISRLKEAGVSGINTLGEFFNYVGLPENPTSEELAGALPRIKATLGYTGTGGGGVPQQDITSQVNLL